MRFSIKLQNDSFVEDLFLFKDDFLIQSETICMPFF